MYKLLTNNNLVVFATIIFGLAAHADVGFVSTNLMKGQVTLSGPFVHQATNFTSSDDPKPNMPPTPVDTLTLTGNDSEITAKVAQLFEQTPYGKTDKEIISDISIEAQGKLPSGRKIEATITIAPLLFTPGTYPGAVRFPFNENKKWITGTAANGHSGFSAFTDVKKNGIGLSISSSGCSPTGDIDLKEVNYRVDQNKLYHIAFSFTANCQGWTGQVVQGQVDLTFSQMK